jgi:urease accessory protein UreH
LNGELRIAARARACGTIVHELDGTEPWRARVVASDRAGARVVLVQTRASIIGGDELVVAISVGERAMLIVDELAATLAHDARGGPPARVSIAIEVSDGGTLVWLGQPLIVAGGAHVDRITIASLAGAGRLLLGETVALGRAAGSAGELVSRTRITIDGGPVVDETLVTGGDGGTLRSPVVAGDAHLIAAVTLAGTRADGPPGTMQAHGTATLWRACGDAVEVESAQTVVRTQWLDALRGRHDEN